MLSRNLYILAATLIVFSLLCYVLGFTGITHEVGAPSDSSLWRTIGIVLLLLGLFVALLGVLQGMFEQAERRTPGGQANIHREHLRQRDSGKNERKRRG
ncbi:hypothetical protein [Terriglobus sp. TAA 43]|uniref:hypothetical protein n=1 Tax=Terriglobus sp. TAA 43 TaxID=278961 RepID=UPI0018DCAC63|nr:hypothetical protein [Terriglobus sp. TAA 43]